MGTQRTLAGLAWSQKGKVTRREQFLAEMDRVDPLEAVARGDRALLLETRAGPPAPGARADARIYFLQQWFNHIARSSRAVSFPFKRPARSPAREARLLSLPYRTASTPTIPPSPSLTIATPLGTTHCFSSTRRLK
jgi:hypothetical protein